MTQSPYASPAADLGTGLPVTMGGGQGDFSIGAAFSEAWAATWRNFPLWLGTSVVWTVAVVAAALTGVGIVLLVPVLGWGMTRFGLRMVDGGATFGDAFSGFSRYGRVLGSMLACGAVLLAISLAASSVETAGTLLENDGVRLAGTFVNLAISLLIVPRLMFGYLLVVDQDLGGFEAVRRSWEVTAPCKWKVVALSLVSFLVALAGLLALIVGVIPASVVGSLMWVSAYRQIAGRPAVG